MHKLILSSLLLFAGCSLFEKDTSSHTLDNGTVSYVKPLWKVKNYKVAYSNTKQSIGISRRNAVHNDKIFIHSIAEDGYRSISAIKWKTGKVLWEWNDVFTKGGNDINLYPHDSYIYDNLLVTSRGNRIYAIDINTGQTEWKYQQNISLEDLYGYEDMLYLSAQPQDENLKDTTGKLAFGYTKNILYQHNIDDFTFIDSLYPHIPNDYKEGWLQASYIYRILPFEYSGDLYLLTVNSNAFTEKYVDITLCLYNSTQKKWVYTYKQVADKSQSNVNHKQYIYKNRVYLEVGGTVNCHNLWTGERIWSRDLLSPIRYGAFIMVGDKIVCNTEAPSNSKMYCLSAVNGSIIWQKPSTYQMSELRHLNGIIYFSGGGTSRIHARRLSDGKEVWSLSPSGYDGAEDFKPDIYSIEGENGKKGRLIIQTYGHAYCIEAYQ